MEAIGIGIIGACGIGRTHARGIAAEPARFALRTLCDTDTACAAEMAAGYGAAVTADYRAVLDDPAIDAVVICLPHDLHVEATVAAAERGKHILLEKPIARIREEAAQIVAAAEQHGVTLMVAHNQRYEPMSRRIKELLAEGVVGDPLYAHTSHHQNFDRPQGGWWRSREAVGGGAVIGSGVHNLDLMRWFFGDPVEAFAMAAYDASRLEAEAAASISVRFRNGAIVNFSCNWGAHGPWRPDEWGIYGTHGHLLTVADGLQVGRDRGRSVETVTADPAGGPSMWAHFADCIATGQAPLTSGPEAARSLELVLKLYKSLETGRPARWEF